MPLTLRVLIGLGAGLLVGLALVDVPSTGAATVISVAATVGAIFINLIRMTVIPLVASMLVASVGSLASSGALGRAGARAALVAVALLAVAALVTIAIAAPVLSTITIDQNAAPPLLVCGCYYKRPIDLQFVNARLQTCYLNTRQRSVCRN